MRIAPARLEDAPLVLVIMQDAYAEYIGVLQPASGAHGETVADVERAMAAGGAVIAWEGDVAVGTCRFEYRPDCLYVGRVAVLPDHRGRGVASEMMRHMEQIARDAGLSAVKVGVRMSLPRNLSLYRRLGYRLVDVQDHPRGPDRVGTLIKDLVRTSTHTDGDSS